MWIIYIKLEQGKSFRNTHDHFVLLFDGGGGGDDGCGGSVYFLKFYCCCFTWKERLSLMHRHILQHILKAKHIVIAVGGRPHIPDEVSAALAPTIFMTLCDDPQKSDSFVLVLLLLIVDVFTG